MARLTYENQDGSWGLKGVRWEQLAALPPRVYGALAKLKDLENLIDEAGAHCGRNAEGDAPALKVLLNMEDSDIQTEVRRAMEWFQKRFETVT